MKRNLRLKTKWTIELFLVENVNQFPSPADLLTTWFREETVMEVAPSHSTGHSTSSGETDVLAVGTHCLLQIDADVMRVVSHRHALTTRGHQLPFDHYRSTLSIYNCSLIYQEVYAKICAMIQFYVFSSGQDDLIDEAK